QGSKADRSVEKPSVHDALLRPIDAAPRLAERVHPSLRSNFARRGTADYSWGVRAPSSHRFLQAVQDQPCQKSKTRRALRRRQRVLWSVPGARQIARVEERPSLQGVATADSAS